MTDEEFFDTFSKMSDDEISKLQFSAFGGTKRKTKYELGQYIKGLGYFVGEYNTNNIKAYLNKLQEDNNLERVSYDDLPFVKNGFEQFTDCKYVNTKKSGNYQNPLIQFFVCNAYDLRFF